MSRRVRAPDPERVWQENQSIFEGFERRRRELHGKMTTLKKETDAGFNRILQKVRAPTPGSKAPKDDSSPDRSGGKSTNVGKAKPKSKGSRGPVNQSSGDPVSPLKRRKGATQNGSPGIQTAARTEPDPRHRDPGPVDPGPVEPESVGPEPVERSLVLDGKLRELTEAEMESSCALCAGDFCIPRLSYVLTCGDIYHRECFAELLADEAIACRMCHAPLFVLK
jgi:hypothetical protein